MFRTKVEINVAVDSIIYAPLYAFVQKNTQSLRGSNFKFFIRAAQDGPELQPGHPLSGLSPIREDPTFSPVIDSQNGGTGNLWFAVGDPLRVRRLVINEENSINEENYSFVGTLVSKPALWFIVENKCTSNATAINNYNYIGCHPEGMTGYYLSELIFKNEHSNPLAPTHLAGTEIEHWEEIIKADRGRRHGRSSKDPVWFGVISTEIDEAVLKEDICRHKKLECPAHYFLYEKFRALVPEYFTFTAIVARRYQDTQSQEVVRLATDELVIGVSEMIKKLYSEDGKDELADYLYYFYKSRPTFSLPKTYAFKKNQIEFFRKILKILDRNKIYPSNLRAPIASKTGSDTLLRRCISSEIELGNELDGETQKVVDNYFEALKTDRWKASNLWE